MVNKDFQMANTAVKSSKKESTITKNQEKIDEIKHLTDIKHQQTFTQNLYARL